MRINENVDPRMRGMEYRDCAKGAHTRPSGRQPRRIHDGPLGHAILKAIRENGNRRIRAA